MGPIFGYLRSLKNYLWCRAVFVEEYIYIYISLSVGPF